MGIINSIAIFCLGFGIGLLALNIELAIPGCYGGNHCLPLYSEYDDECCRSPVFPIPLAREVPSPSNFIKQNDIKVTDERVIIDVSNTTLVSFADTNSMDPVLDSTSNAIEKAPESSDDIQVGDIISYKYEDYNIIHRVVKIGEDGKGWYCMVKGDNNFLKDPDKVRFDQIIRYVVAIIY